MINNRTRTTSRTLPHSNSSHGHDRSNRSNRSHRAGDSGAPRNRYESRPSIPRPSTPNMLGVPDRGIQYLAGGGDNHIYATGVSDTVIRSSKVDRDSQKASLSGYLVGRTISHLRSSDDPSVGISSIPTKRAWAASERSFGLQGQPSFSSTLERAYGSAVEQRNWVAQMNRQHPNFKLYNAKNIISDLIRLTDLGLRPHDINQNNIFVNRNSELVLGDYDRWGVSPGSRAEQVLVSEMQEFRNSSSTKREEEQRFIDDDMLSEIQNDTSRRASRLDIGYMQQYILEVLRASGYSDDQAWDLQPEARELNDPNDFKELLRYIHDKLE